MRQRSATCCGVPRATTQRSSSLRRSGDKTRGATARGITHYVPPWALLSIYLWDTTLAIAVLDRPPRRVQIDNRDAAPSLTGPSASICRGANMSLLLSQSDF